MSPEQARGQEVDARADLFSMGLVLYYCLAGEPLYRGTTSYEVLLHAATGPTVDDLTRLRALPEPAGTIIERALQVDPGARYQSAAEFLAAVAPHVGRGGDRADRDHEPPLCRGPAARGGALLRRVRGGLTTAGVHRAALERPSNVMMGRPSICDLRRSRRRAARPASAALRIVRRAAVVTLSTLQAAYQAGADQPFGVGLLAGLLRRVSTLLFPGLAQPDPGIPRLHPRRADRVHDHRRLGQLPGDLGPAALHLRVGVERRRAERARRWTCPGCSRWGPRAPSGAPFIGSPTSRCQPTRRPDRYRSVRVILRDRLPLFPGPTRLATLLPSADMGPEETSRFLLPKLRPPERIGRPRPRRGWLDRDGREVFALDFGENRFQYNERDEIIEQPLFFFFGRDEAGPGRPTPPSPGWAAPGRSSRGRRAAGPRQPPALRIALALARRPPSPDRPRLRAARAPSRVGGAQRRPRPGPSDGGGAARRWSPPPPSSTSTPSRCCSTTPAWPGRPSPPPTWPAAPGSTRRQSIERHLGHVLYPSEILVACPYLSFGGSAVPSSPP